MWLDRVTFFLFRSTQVLHRIEQYGPCGVDLLASPLMIVISLVRMAANSVFTTFSLVGSIVIWPFDSDTYTRLIEEGSLGWTNTKYAFGHLVYSLHNLLTLGLFKLKAVNDDSIDSLVLGSSPL